MTREEATEMVEDFLQAVRDLETFYKRQSYRDDYWARKEQLITRLTTRDS